MLEPRLFVYSACLAASCGYALICGGRPERWGAGINLAGSLVSLLVGLLTPAIWQSAMAGLSLIDLLVALGFLALAIGTTRYWPIWAFGFSIAGVTAHLARVIQPAVPAMAYFRSEAIWAYPSLAALAIGTWSVRRARKTGGC
jgi:hypothetical protein